MRGKLVLECVGKVGYIRRRWGGGALRPSASRARIERKTCMAEEKIGEIEFRPFDRDYERVARLINETWLEKWRGAMMFQYSPEFLRWNFEGPRIDGDFVQDIYSGGRYAGFYAGLYRRFSLSGREVITSLATFLASVKGVRPGLPLYISRRDSALMREKGYAAGLQVFDEAFSNLELMKLLARKQKVRVDVVREVDWWYKIFDVKRLAACEPLNVIERIFLKFKTGVPPAGPLGEHVRPYKSSDLEACLELLNGIEREARPPYLVRRWDAEELAWQLKYDGVADTLVYESNGRAGGLINFYRIHFVHRTREPGAVIDNVCFGDMSGPERRALLLRALGEFKEQGAVMAGVMDSPLVDREALSRVGFVKARRPMKLIAGVVEPSVSFEGIDQCYFDVR